MAREALPVRGPSVFVGGLTPRLSRPVDSWRSAVIAELDTRWDGDEPLTVFPPELRGGFRAAHYDDQVGWEADAREQADVVSSGSPTTTAPPVYRADPAPVRQADHRPPAVRCSAGSTDGAGAFPPGSVTQGWGRRLPRIDKAPLSMPSLSGVGHPPIRAVVAGRSVVPGTQLEIVPRFLKGAGDRPCWRCASCRRRGPAGRCR
nr:nucleoside 2-deoxyribosyltransferase domain-containing protein [Streptomyces sp. 2131.1]